ncbi:MULTISPECIES: undecaprenyl-diphosphate phosphatase [unclassified Aeromicrobium]|uniref:undecaprenyl-diphosphate phosphatase n=1 Tax=unclassified Aeromicrobium TaxID=2633570 RepID=UPI00209827A5|nr:MULTISPECIES: undecaprenyl-diphosphate phosphatase [unclassified Aeromicrobium]MCO7239423.1 undecaprenyl-diphosphate phosphatase [Aeromicrobium sp. CnD17-E]MDR6119480.1 undecaprenyl-diphosphatase [Aeromicrobium sp. SORGH_AS_0981]
MDVLRSVVLGLVQGLTEFLPISSSAHLAIVPRFLGWDDPGAAYTAVVQIGTELAVVLYFWKDIWRIGTGWLRGLVSSDARALPEWRMGWFVIVGSMPIVLLGLALESLIDRQFRNLWVIATMLIVLGVVLGVAERVGRRTRPIEQLTWTHAVALGLAQAAAVVPGVSRSGATISMGLLLGYERAAATRFAFLLAIPAVVGAGLYKLKDVPGGENAYGWGPTLIGTVVSFVVGLAVIHWLLQYVSKHSYAPFVVYRIALGTLVLALLAFGVIGAGVSASV